MIEMTGTYQNGQVKLDSAVDWPDGARVTVAPSANTQSSIDPEGNHEWGLDEAEFQETPEFRKKLITQMESFEPLERTPQEEAEWQAARKWIKEYSLAAVRREMGLQP